MADHYETLGVGRNATPDEIKRAYRRLARELHPDTNDDPTAEERFKEVTRAYETLSDPDKRRRYDTFGDERTGAAGFSDFGGISDLFSSFFGGGFSARSRTGPARGADILAELELTLEEADAGVERDVEVTTLVTCADCEGSGAAPGTYPTTCTACGGTGEQRHVRQTVFGNVMTASTCSTCGGSGREVASPCPRCHGRGRVEVTETLTVEIPAGVDDGAQLRVSGRGEAGVRGGRAGDLYVAISIAPHETFRRAGDDLACEVPVPMTIAALGGEVQIPTLIGTETVEIRPGTQSGEVVRLRGKGMSRLSGRGRGTLVGLLKVETPTELDDEQVRLLQEFARARGEEAGERGFFDRIKEAFHQG
ncbi:MAG TPA: molecular chaperone DnaJ [Actinomycetota bacterium]|nr:molecular chaperone DnaJ [Actinomycetota bacterium]